MRLPGGGRAFRLALPPPHETFPLPQVNGKCIEQQSCLRMENGAYCRAADGECIVQGDGTVRGGEKEMDC